jgi:hypothetical protein
VDRRIDELGRLKQQLTSLRQQCGSPQAIEDCGIIHGLADMPSQEKAPSSSHLG